MRTLWMVSVTFVLVSILPSCRPTDELKKCKGHFDCKGKFRSECIHSICYTEFDDCGGKTCNLAKYEVCLNNTCVSDEICWARKDNKTFSCSRKGRSCGGQFCGMTSKCINDTCYYYDADCVGGGDGIKCGYMFTGTCEGGVCFEPCGVNNRCSCKDNKYCTASKCEETSCW